MLSIRHISLIGGSNIIILPKEKRKAQVESNSESPKKPAKARKYKTPERDPKVADADPKRKPTSKEGNKIPKKKKNPVVIDLLMTDSSSDISQERSTSTGMA